jgi:branched-chain amino acid transport system ATP-binding protein
MTQPLLAIRSLRAAYGKIEALKGVDRHQFRRDRRLIGANGAGCVDAVMTTSANRGPDRVRQSDRDPLNVAAMIARLRIAQRRIAGSSRA